MLCVFLFNAGIRGEFPYVFYRLKQWYLQNRAMFRISTVGYWRGFCLCVMQSSQGVDGSVAAVA